MFLTTVIVLIYVRSLYVQNTGYNPYDQGANYIQAKYFDPPLPANRSHEAPAPYEWVPVDDEIRYYDSPVHYNPMNCECAPSAMLCPEGYCDGVVQMLDLDLVC